VVSYYVFVGLFFVLCVAVLDISEGAETCWWWPTITAIRGKC
jgi:hypothetical protein